MTAAGRAPVAASFGVHLVMLGPHLTRWGFRDGMWLRDVDLAVIDACHDWVDAWPPEDRVEVVATFDPADAAHFDDWGAAMCWWMELSADMPVRPDGYTNRPRTAFPVEVLRFPA